VSEVAGLKQRDYQLSAAAPFQAESKTFRSPTRLQIEVHAECEVGILFAGAQRRSAGGWSYTAKAGDVWLCGSWEPHGWEILAPDTSDVVVMFLPDFLRDEQIRNMLWLHLFTAVPAARPRVHDEKTRKRILAIAIELKEDIEEQGPGWEGAVRLNILRLLLTLARRWQPAQPCRREHVAEGSRLGKLMPAIALAATDPARRINLAEAAGLCGFSRSQFSSIFRQTMGLTFGEFQMQARLGLAARLLISTEQPIESVAEASGFCDHSHLHRAFLKHYAVSPGRYRDDPVLPTVPPEDSRSVPKLI